MHRKAPPHRAPIAAYFDAVGGLTFAPDMQVLFVYAQFHSDYQEHKSTGKALESLDLKLLAESLADLELVRVARMPPPVIPEPQGDQKEDAEGDKNSKAKKSAKRRRFVPQALNLRVPLHQSAPYNVAKLTVDGLKLSFHHLPVDLFSNECPAELQNMLQDLTSILKVWEGISQTMPEKFSAPFVEMVDPLARDLSVRPRGGARQTLH